MIYYTRSSLGELGRPVSETGRNKIPTSHTLYLEGGKGEEGMDRTLYMTLEGGKYSEEKESAQVRGTGSCELKYYCQNGLY